MKTSFNDGKIVAFVPARKCSKRIPYKMMQLIGSKPLVYYAVENACRSHMIDEVIVSTDSYDVAIIAEQIGAKVLMRDDFLCGDEITIDEVACKVLSEIDYDYVVTLEPTCPALEVSTLDSAIRYMLDHPECDTLISAYRNAALSWKKNIDGTFSPEYENRVNSQWLSPHYVEAGAFIISSCDNLDKCSSRIGNSVSMYEISALESVRVSTFHDLALVRSLMEDVRIAFYANGSNSIGLGHICRVMDLACEFYSAPDIYYDMNVTDSSVFDGSGLNLIGIEGFDDLLLHVKQREYSVFINDILDTGEDYMKRLKEENPNTRVINFEDCGAGAEYADAVVNALYESDGKTKHYYGHKYYIAPKPFLFYEPVHVRPRVKEILVSFGGADPRNYTDMLLDIIAKNSDKYALFHFTVVCGLLKEPITEERFAGMGNIDILHHIQNIAAIMSKSDIAVASRGRTCYELCLFGIPTISIAENEREQQHSFIIESNGFDYLGLNPTSEMLEEHLDLLLFDSFDRRLEMHNKMISCDLKNGRKRVVNIIKDI